MSKKMLIIHAIVILVIGSGVFYGGMLYGKKGNAGSGGGPNFAGNRQRFAQGGAQGFTAGQRNNRMGANLVSGTIVSKDAQSITIKLNDPRATDGQGGGSKIVFVSDKTTVLKSVAGALADLNVDAQVMITGSSNQDGSVTAQSIQLR